MTTPVPASLDVLSVGFCPLKGGRHEPRPGARIGPAGPEGDRRYCLVDPARHEVLKTVRNPRLIGVRVHEIPQPEGPARLRVRLPDGKVVEAVPAPVGAPRTGDYWGRSAALQPVGGGFSEAFSAWLGREVLLVAAPAGDVVYGGPIAVAFSASIEELGRRTGHPDLLAEHARFRSTLLVRTRVPFSEDHWEGARTVLRRPDGPDLPVRIGAGIPRCAVVNLDPVTGEANAGLLKEMSRFRPANARGEPLFCAYAELLEDPPEPSAASSGSRAKETDATRPTRDSRP